MFPQKSYLEDSYEIIRKFFPKDFLKQCFNDEVGFRIFIPYSMFDDFLEECSKLQIRILAIEGYARNLNQWQPVEAVRISLFDLEGSDWADLVNKSVIETRRRFSQYNDDKSEFLHFTLRTKVKAYPCACCGYLTRSNEEYGTHEICPVCGWEDDFVQASDANFPGGANRESLVEARDNFKKIGVSSTSYLGKLRAPKEDEIP